MRPSWTVPRKLSAWRSQRQQMRRKFFSHANSRSIFQPVPIDALTRLVLSRRVAKLLSSSSDEAFKVRGAFSRCIVLIHVGNSLIVGRTANGAVNCKD